MKTLLIITTVVFLSSLPLLASAAGKEKGSDKKDSVELELSVALGGPIGLIGADYPDGVSTAPFTVAVAGRIGFPAWSSLRLEASSVLGYNLGANLIIDWVKIGPVRIHIGDPGLAWNPNGKAFSVRRVRRSYDLVFGAGADWRVTDHVALSLDWRTFIPDPIHYVPITYGNFASDIYSEALRGGQLWVRVSYIW